MTKDSSIFSKQPSYNDNSNHHRNSDKQQSSDLNEALANVSLNHTRINRRYTFTLDRSAQKSTLPSMNSSAQKSTIVKPDFGGMDPRKSLFSLPLSPKDARHRFAPLLTEHEQSEILNYSDIYFMGSASIHKIGTLKRKTGADFSNECNIPGTFKETKTSVYNHGYDDSHGDLYLTKNDHIAYRYEIISLLGKGSFGQVVKCFDHKRKELVAVKIVRNKKRFEEQGAVEVKILNKLRSEDPSGDCNYVHVLNNFVFRGHLCFSFEILGINLFEWIKAGHYSGVHLGVIKTIAKQIINCLKKLQECKVIHSDLKPENILLVDTKQEKPSRYDMNPSSINSISNAQSFRSQLKIPPEFEPDSPQHSVKVIDFGSSCYEAEKMYTYVQSRFYRSPEIILGIPYTTAIDMWSFGCILAELLTGSPIFPGENEQDQLSYIMEVLGAPSSDIIAQGKRSHLFFNGNLPKIVPNSRGVIKRPLSKTLGSVLKCSDMSFLDFLNKCLQWDAKERMTPQEALEHPFICGQRYIPTLNQLKIPKTFRHSVASNSAIEMSDVIVPRVFGNTIQYQKPPLRQQYSNPVLTEIDALPQISPRQLPLTPKRMSKLDQSTPNRKWR